MSKNPLHTEPFDVENVRALSTLSTQTLASNPIPTRTAADWAAGQSLSTASTEFQQPDTSNHLEIDQQVQTDDPATPSPPPDQSKPDPSSPANHITITHHPPELFHDGGFKAWLTVAGAFFVMFVSFGWISAVGVFQYYYQSHQLAQYKPSDIAWISSLEVYFLFAGGPIVGWLYDRFGPRYLLFAGTIMHIGGLLAASFAKEYYQFLLSQGVCSSIGTSLLFHPAISTIPSWFFKKRAFALGIATAGSSLGGVIFPIMVYKLLPRIGFGWTMRAAILLILVLVIPANLMIRSRVKPVSRPWSLMQHLEPLHDRKFRWLAFGCALYFFGLFLPLTFSVSQARHAGLSPGTAAYVLPILNAASLFGRIIPGWLADKFGRFNVIIIMCFLSGIVDLALWIPAKTVATIFIFAAVYGFASGGFVSMVPALVAQITPNVQTIGVRTGTLFFILSFSVLAGNPIGGKLVSRWNGEYTGLQIFCGVFQLAGGFVLIFARIVIGGTGLKTKV